MNKDVTTLRSLFEGLTDNALLLGMAIPMELLSVALEYNLYKLGSSPNP